MRIAFVGVKRKYMELSEPYRDDFNRYHLELPFYYARDGANEVTISTVDYCDSGRKLDRGFLRCETETKFKADKAIRYDVVVHWRKWFPELYRPEAINVLNCQDHSLSGEWVAAVTNAYREKKLRAVLAFPRWHGSNIAVETGLPPLGIVTGLTLGVDTDIYKPSPKKNFHRMLWASDPGRGLGRAIQLALELFQRDKEFRLHICYPDYCPPQQKIQHPVIVWEGTVPNGPRLWNLFNECGVLPYTSTFMEPSSRAHRQAQAAGSLVLYPPGMGTPSDLIQENGGGIVAPIDTWARKIHEFARLMEGNVVCPMLAQARLTALNENWAVQAERFNDFFERELKCR